MEAIGLAIAFFVPPEAVIDGAIAIGIGIGSTSKATFDAALTTAVVDKFRCIVFIHDTFDGTITPFQYGEIVTDVTAQIGGFAQTFILNWMAALGPVGMSKASGAAGIATGDCSACEGLTFTRGSGEILPANGSSYTMTADADNDGTGNYTLEFSSPVPRSMTATSYVGWCLPSPPSFYCEGWSTTSGTPNADSFNAGAVTHWQTGTTHTDDTVFYIRSACPFSVVVQF
jgi:hypothetical protein